MKRQRKRTSRPGAAPSGHHSSGADLARPSLLTSSEVAAALRKTLAGIHVVFMLNDDGTLSSTVFLHDARNPTMSRRCHILDIEKLLKPPLDPQVANTIAQWRAEQEGIRGSA
jgi:hypothetical protein